MDFLRCPKGDDESRAYQPPCLFVGHAGGVLSCSGGVTEKATRGLVMRCDDENVGERMLSRGRVAGSRAIGNALRRSRTTQTRRVHSSPGEDTVIVPRC